MLDIHNIHNSKQGKHSKRKFEGSDWNFVSVVVPQRIPAVEYFADIVQHIELEVEQIVG
jgi:hypothetical protein